MKTNKDHNAAARSIFMSSIEWLANIGAVAVTFFLTPLAYNASMGWVAKFTHENYGIGMIGPVSLIWGGIVVLFIFFTARMSLGTVLVMGGLTVAARIFVA